MTHVLETESNTVPLPQEVPSAAAATATIVVAKITRSMMFLLLEIITRVRLSLGKSDVEPL